MRIARPPRARTALHSQLEDHNRKQDEHETQPPTPGRAETAEKGVADVVDFVGRVVDGRQDDVPEEPAADGEEEGEGVCEGFGVGFYESVKQISKPFPFARVEGEGNEVYGGREGEIHTASSTQSTKPPPYT